jgi:hypothetical protein
VGYEKLWLTQNLYSTGGGMMCRYLLTFYIHGLLKLDLVKCRTSYEAYPYLRKLISVLYKMNNICGCVVFPDPNLSSLMVFSATVLEVIQETPLKFQKQNSILILLAIMVKNSNRRFLHKIYKCKVTILLTICSFHGYFISLSEAWTIFFSK